MKINNYLINLSISLLIIFGGTFLITYVRTGNILVPQGVATIVGIVLMISAVSWRLYHRKKEQNPSS